MNIKIVYVNVLTNALTNILILPYYIRKLKLDVFLFQNFISPFCNCIKINYIHDILFLDYPQYFTSIEKLYFWPIKYLAKKSNHIITISNSEKNRIVKHRIAKSEKISVVYHGVSKKFKSDHLSGEIEKIKKKYNLPDKFLLFVGRVNQRKNLSTLVKALKYVHDISLVIVGKEDNQGIDLKHLVSSLNLDDRVVLTGHLEDIEIPLIYASAHVFCFPSFAEGFGLPPLEAMASGTPVVLSNKTAIPEICGEAGNYFDPESEKDLAHQINKLLLDNSHYKDSKSKGLKTAKNYDWAIAAKTINGIFKKLLNK